MAKFVAKRVVDSKDVLFRVIDGQGKSLPSCESFLLWALPLLACRPMNVWSQTLTDGESFQFLLLLALTFLGTREKFAGGLSRPT
jgi:hypothetical protein